MDTARHARHCCHLFPSHSAREGTNSLMRRTLLHSISNFIVILALFSAQFFFAQGGGELHFAMKTDPKTLNPALVEDQGSEVIRYLTGGVLIRVNRQSQVYQPELATRWKISKDGKSITFTLRQGVKFSDGSDFT